MGHRYIVSSTPYLVTSGRPIYKVPTRGNVSNPNHMPNGSVHTLIQIDREEQNDMLDIIIEPPQEYVESEQELTITIQPVQEEVREPVKTRKIRVGNKVAVVPIETATITIL